MSLTFLCSIKGIKIAFTQTKIEAQEEEEDGSLLVIVVRKLMLIIPLY